MPVAAREGGGVLEICVGRVRRALKIICIESSVSNTNTRRVTVRSGTYNRLSDMLLLTAQHPDDTPPVQTGLQAQNSAPDDETR